MGDSHVGSLKRGWDNINSEHPGKEITFFAHRANGLSGLIPKDKKLIPDNEDLVNALKFTSGGKQEIDPEAYDIFLIYALGLTINFTQSRRFYSKAVIKKSLNDFVESTMSFQLLKRLRDVTNKKIFIGHIPFAAAMQILPDTKPADYVSRVKLMNDIIYRTLNCELVLQPLNTIVNGNNTHHDFSKNSMRLAVGDHFDNEYHPEDDNFHMNDKFGEIWLKEFIMNNVDAHSTWHTASSEESI
jgi:hypothetical protein